MIRLARVICVFALLAALASAVDFSALRPEGFVNDFAQVLDARTEQALEKYCAAVEQSTGAQMVLVTLDTLSGEPVEDVANLLARTWGIGSGESDEGVLLLLVIRDRTSRLEVGYGLEPIIPDGYAGRLLREMRPALRANDYNEAMAVAATQLGGRIAEAKNVQIQFTPPTRGRDTNRRPHIPFGSIIGGVIFLLWLTGMGGGRRRRGGMGGLLTGMLLGNMLGRGMYGSSRSGGGFGGYDSHDSFGGFGGGDFGGGGASGSW